MSHDVIVIGASAGGVAALKAVVAGLPRDFPAALFVTLHVPAHHRSLLPEILARAGPLPARHPRDGEPIQCGQIYVAPPGRHLLLRNAHIALSSGPRENGARPAADPMFRSAARSYGARVIGVVLSGTLDDGTSGLGAIKARSGITVAQDPESAMYGDMPRSAIEAGVVDLVVPLSQIAPQLIRLAGKPESPKAASAAAELREETEVSDGTVPAGAHAHGLGQPTDFTCPDCGGVLRLIEPPDPPHFRCAVGHAWSAESLMAAKWEKIEESLWAALRVLTENARLTRRLRDLAVTPEFAQRFEERLHDLDQHAQAIRELLLDEGARESDEHA